MATLAEIQAKADARQTAPSTGRLAAIQAKADQRRGPPPPEPPATRRGVLGTALELPRALLRGAGQAVEFAGDVGDVLTYGGKNLVTGDWGNLGEGFSETEADRLRGRIADKTGWTALTERRLAPDQGPMAEGLVSAAEAGGGAVTGGGLASLPAKVASVTGALGAGAGRTGAELADLGPMGTMIAEIGGELGGGFAPSLARVAKRLATKGVDRLINLNDPEVTAEALATVKDALTAELSPVDADAVFKTLRERIAAGDQGTLSTLAPTPGIGGLEDVAVKKVEGGVGLREARQAQTRQQAVDRLRDEAPAGDPVRAAREQRALTGAMAAKANQAQSRANQAADVAEQTGLIDVNAAIDEAEALAARGTQEAEGSLAGAQRAADAARVRAMKAPDPEAAGLALSERIGEQRDAAVTAERAAWADVEDGIEIPTTKFKQEMESLLGEMSQAERRKFEASKGAELKQIRALGDTESAKELIGLERAIREPYDGDPSYLEAINARASAAVTRALDDAPNFGKAFQAAKAASKNRITTFDTGLMGKGRRAARDAPANIINQIVKGEVPGGAAVDAAIKAGAGDAARDALRAQFQRRAFPSGTFAPGAAQGFLARFKPALDRFDGLADELQGIVDAEQGAVVARRDTPKTLKAVDAARKTAVDAAEKQRTSLTKTREAADVAAKARREKRGAAIEKTPAGQFQGATPKEVSASARKVLNQTVGGRAKARSLRKGAERGGPQAVEDLQRAFYDATVEDLLSVRGEGDKLPQEPAALLARRRETLSEVLDPEQIDRLGEVMDPISWIKNTDVTKQELEELSAPALANFLVRSFVAGSAQAFGANSLMAANMASNQVQRYMNRIPNTKYRKLVAEFVLYPERFVAALEAAGPPPATPAATVTWLERNLPVLAGASTATSEE